MPSALLLDFLFPSSHASGVVGASSVSALWSDFTSPGSALGDHVLLGFRCPRHSPGTFPPRPTSRFGPVKSSALGSDFPLLAVPWPCLGRLGALKGLRGPRHSRWTSSPPRPMPRVFSVPRVSRHSGQTSPLLAVPWVTMGSWAFDVLDTLLWRCFGGHRSLQCSSWGSLGPSFRELLREILRGVPTQSRGSRLRALRGNWVSPSCRPKRNYSRALLLQGSDSITWLSSPALKRRGPPPSFRPKRN